MMKRSNVKDTSLAYYDYAECMKLYKIRMGDDTDEVRVISVSVRTQSEKEPKHHDQMTIVDAYGMPERKRVVIYLEYVPRTIDSPKIIDIIADIPAENYADIQTDNTSEDGHYVTCRVDLPNIIDMYS